MTNDLTSRWDARYRQTSTTTIPAPAEVLAENSHLLPATGNALDVACGSGNNALFLAAHGLQTTAWDISPVAIGKLLEFSSTLQLTIDARTRDVEARPPGPQTFDVITVSRFLIRHLAPALITALRPRGLLFYQTFTAIKIDRSGPDNPDFLLAENELLTLFRGLIIRVYREEGRLGNPQLGFRNAALLVAQKPP